MIHFYFCSQPCLKVFLARFYFAQCIIIITVTIITIIFIISIIIIIIIIIFSLRRFLTGVSQGPKYTNDNNIIPYKPGDSKFFMLLLFLVCDICSRGHMAKRSSVLFRLSDVHCYYRF